ncbi:rCG27288 [Rattus norvegicus]|uniref:RCG27288 n=1 Tax=Rattus norvegicus TaxID=10116 RepID=A6HQG4_RAT|nr:rCG27288 [Rattus norvegicus]
MCTYHRLSSSGALINCQKQLKLKAVITGDRRSCSQGNPWRATGVALLQAELLTLRKRQQEQWSSS